MSLKSKIHLLSGIILIIVSVTCISCSKEPGTGGNATMYGKVMVKDYNAYFTILNEEYFGQDVDVYLIYGNDRSYSEHVRTNYDGSYEFRYLRPGDYHVFCYSDDTTMQTLALIPVIKDVTITSNKESVEVPLITIAK